MKTKQVGKGVSGYTKPILNKELPPEYKLAALADQNGMLAKDIVSRAMKGSGPFLDMVESVGLADVDLSPALAKQADALNLAASERIKQRLKAIADSRKQEPKIDDETQHDADSATTDDPMPVPKPAKTKPPKPPKIGKQEKAKLFGFHITAVLRWMGANGWSKKDTLQVLKVKGITEVAESTVAIQLKAGATGKRGEPAPLTKAHAKDLKSCLRPN
jgi:hypothetical protein